MPRILVVDDDPSVRALVRDVLEREGHEVRTVEDGFAALRAVAADRPDCVVLDLALPGLEGFEVLALLRGADGGASLPVVVLTGHPDDLTAWRAWHAGVDRLLGKPVDADELLRSLASLLPASVR